MMARTQTNCGLPNSDATPRLLLTAAPDPTETPDSVRGLVLRVDAKVCEVEVVDDQSAEARVAADGANDTHATPYSGQVLKVPLRGKLFDRKHDDVVREKRPIAVGDRVIITGLQDGGAIDEVLPRKTRLARRTSGEGDREQVLAANISLVLVCTAVREPPFQPELVDRVLAGAAREGIDAALVLTKVDLDRKGLVAKWQSLYESLGYPVFATSIEGKGERTPEVLDQLRTLLSKHVSVLSGLSGVGKSSLLNALEPGLALRVGTLSRIRQGKHTTTHTSLLRLPHGGHVLDTPGIRSFGLFGTSAQELSFYFREFVTRMSACGYRNCSHVEEPDCAIRAAVEAGEIAETRYASYRLLLDDVASRDDY